MYNVTYSARFFFKLQNNYCGSNEKFTQRDTRVNIIDIGTKS